MRFRRLAGTSITQRIWRVSGPIVTVSLIAVIEALPLQGTPALPLLLMLAIAYSVLVGGMAPGIVSSVISVAYAAYSYRTPGAPLGYASGNLERLMIFVLATPLVVATLGNLRKRLDDLLLRERNLRRQAEAEHERAVGIIESITDGFFALDRQWRYTYVNQQAEQLVGRTREDLLGKVVWDAFPPLVGSTWDREYHRAVEQRVSVHFEEFYPPLDTWFETHAYPSEEGLTIYIQSINKRKRAELASQVRARQQAALASLGQEALLGGDIRSLFDAAVRTVAATLEIELVKILELLPDGEELVMRAGVGWRDGVEHRVDAGARSQAGFTLVSDTPVVVEDLSTERRFEGPPLLIEHGVVSGISVIIAGHERPFGVLGAHTRKKRVFPEDDIHFLQTVANVLAEAIERKRGEAALAESEQRFRQIAENVREVFYIRTVHPAQVLYINPAYETVWGRPCASLYAQPNSWLEAIHPDDRPGIERSLPVRDGGFFDGEYRVVRPDGAVRWIHARSSSILDESGSPYRVVGIAEDVTESKEAEEAARRLAASEASIRARDEVLAVVAHDLQNPLNSISMAATLLERTELPPEKRGLHARTIKRAVGTAVRLIQDLLDVARIEAGQLSIELETLDVASLVSEACDAFVQPANEKSIALECTVSADVPHASGDRDRILQVLGNLLSNAIKFTPQGGRILVRVQRCPDGIEFSVEDTGPGIDREALPNVFDRFWRARPSDRKGLGLGLAIVKGIVSAHRGRVWAKSEIGKGSVFYFSLPVDSTCEAAPHDVRGVLSPDCIRTDSL
jgi:PAS domain S-box-containing protein